MRAIMIQNAPTFLDELQDPSQLRVDEDALARLDFGVRLTEGSESPPIFPAVIDRLVELIPRATRERITEAAHVPHLTAPERYIEVTRKAIRQGMV